jgi:hypothetical protein
MNSYRILRSLVGLSSLALLTSCGDTAGGSDVTTVAPTGGPSNTTTGATTSTAIGSQTTAAQTSASGASGGSGPTGSTTSVATTSTGASTTSSAGTTGTTTGQSTSAVTTAATSSTTTTATTNGSGMSSSSVEETTETPDLDVNGKGNATPGTTASEPQDYIRLGELRILNNNWGSEDLGCTAPNSTMSVFVKEDGSFGWDFARGDCAGPTDTSHPDFPQLEFGIHPFGIGSELATSPEFSSTTLLPLQIKDIQSASVTLDNFNIQLGGADSWNIAMEFWLSERDPINDPNPGVYAELMAWWGWDQGRWPCDDNNMDGQNDFGDTVQAGNMSYRLCHQNDQWADGWRYYQFRAGDATDGNIKTTFSGTLDVKAFLNYLVQSRNYSPDLWVTRIEVGSEIDDNTNGTVSMKGAKFEINGQERSQVIGTP